MDSGGYYVEIARPACGGVIEVDAPGVDVTCPHCGAILHRRRRQQPEHPTPAVAAAPAGSSHGIARQQTQDVPRQTPAPQAQEPSAPQAPAPQAQEPSASGSQHGVEGLERVVVRDRSGRALIRAVVPEDWRSVAGVDSSLASESCPFAVRLEMRDGEKVIRYHSFRTFPIRRGSNIAELPDVELPEDVPFVHPSAWMDAKAREATGTDASTLVFDESPDFSQHNNRHTEELHHVFEDEIARSNESSRRMAFDGVGAQSHINACCHHIITRLYHFEHEGRPFRLAVHARVFVKNYTLVMPTPRFAFDALGGFAQQLGQRGGAGRFGQRAQAAGRQTSAPAAAQSARGGFLDSLVDSGLVGGVIGQRVRAQRQQAMQVPAYQGEGYGVVGENPAIVPEAWQEPQVQAQPTASSLEAALASPDPDVRIPAVVNAGTGDPGFQIEECCLMHFSTFAAPANEFQEVFDTSYSHFVYSEALDESLMDEVKQWRTRVNQERDARFQSRLAAQRQMSEALTAATKAQCDAALAQNEAMLARARSVNASIDARNEQFRAGVSQRMAASNADHQAFRARQAVQFGGAPASGLGGSSSYGGGMSSAERFSQEVILGQSTYVDQYGDRHTVSSQADRAWIDRAGNVVGTESWVDPGPDWTEMDKL